MSLSVTTKNVSLVDRFAQRYGVEPAKLLEILKATAFKQKQKKDQSPQVVTNEQLAALMIVSEQYGLNPFIREIYAFPAKDGGIVPLVSVDGFVRIVENQSQYDGVEFRQSEDIVQIDERARLCPEWIEATIYRKDRSRPTTIREHLDEVYRPAFVGQDQRGREYFIDGPWQTHTKRMLRHKAFKEAARMAFGFSGIHDEDDGERIIESQTSQSTILLPSPSTEKKPASDSTYNLDNLDELVQLTDRPAERLLKFCQVNTKPDFSLQEVIEAAIKDLPTSNFLVAFDKWNTSSEPEKHTRRGRPPGSTNKSSAKTNIPMPSSAESELEIKTQNIPPSVEMTNEEKDMIVQGEQRQTLIDQVVNMCHTLDISPPQACQNRFEHMDPNRLTIDELTDWVADLKQATKAVIEDFPGKTLHSEPFYIPAAFRDGLEKQDALEIFWSFCGHFPQWDQKRVTEYVREKSDANGQPILSFIMTLKELRRDHKI